jgi:LAO/AO transport system kinase
LDGHHEWLTSHGELEARRTRRAEREIEAIAVAALRARLGGMRGGEALAQLAKQVAAGQSDPYTAADQLTAGF